jgi:transposase
MAILNVGIDLAKNVFALHGVNERGQVDLRRPSVPRTKLHALVAALPPCTIGMEACSGAHHWARLFAQHGHTVKLMAPKFVTPYRMSGKRGKTDAADAAAICEAMQRPNMRFVPVKTAEQQSRLMVHRARQGYVEARTALFNRIRGLRAEFGVVLPQKAEVVRREAARHMDTLPGYGKTVIEDLLAEVRHLDERVRQYDVHVQAMARDSTPAQQLMQIRGHRRGHGHRHRRHGGQRPRVQQQPPVRRLARSGARAVQLGWQDTPGAHHQGRRCLSARSARHGRACRAQRRPQQDRQHQSLGNEHRAAA